MSTYGINRAELNWFPPSRSRLVRFSSAKSPVGFSESWLKKENGFIHSVSKETSSKIFDSNCVFFPGKTMIGFFGRTVSWVLFQLSNFYSFYAFGVGKKYVIRKNEMLWESINISFVSMRETESFRCTSENRWVRKMLNTKKLYPAGSNFRLVKHCFARQSKQWRYSLAQGWRTFRSQSHCRDSIPLPHASGGTRFLNMFSFPPDFSVSIGNQRRVYNLRYTFFLDPKQLYVCTSISRLDCRTTCVSQ